MHYIPQVKDFTLFWYPLMRVSIGLNLNLNLCQLGKKVIQFGKRVFEKPNLRRLYNGSFFVFTGTPQVSILAVSKRLAFGSLILANILGKVIEFFIRHLRPLNYPLIAEARRLTTPIWRNSPLF
jgi:hypothetical protein